MNLVKPLSQRIIEKSNSGIFILMIHLKTEMDWTRQHYPYKTSGHASHSAMNKGLESQVPCLCEIKIPQRVRVPTSWDGKPDFCITCVGVVVCSIDDGLLDVRDPCPNRGLTAAHGPPAEHPSQLSIPMIIQVRDV